MYPMEDTRAVNTGPNCPPGLQVLAQCWPIDFRDGSRVDLHRVAQGSSLSTFLRAVRLEGLQWLVIDLRRLSEDIENDVLRLQPRDTPGVVLYTLRGLYPGKAAFVVAAQVRCMAQWWHADVQPLVAEAA